MKEKYENTHTRQKKLLEKSKENQKIKEQKKKMLIHHYHY